MNKIICLPTNSIMPFVAYLSQHRKKYSLVAFVLMLGLSIQAQFTITYNSKTGAISSIINPNDKNRMNWIFSSADSIPTYQKEVQDWGMGKYSIATESGAWPIPIDKSINNNSATLHYKTKHLDVDVKRVEEGKYFIETYHFRNTTGKVITIDSLSIYSPLNDNYPDSKTCATNRCNVHLWAALNSSYINAIRMDGVGPHLGLVFTKGAMASYSIENRGVNGGGNYKSSNTRGTILLNMPTMTLKPNEEYTVQWKLFWHNGWDDFFVIAKTMGFVRVDADKYVMNQNESVKVKLDANVKLKNKVLMLPTAQIGEHSMPIKYGDNQQTLINYLVISSPQNLIDKRIHFIVDHQQMNDPNDPRYGAYMVYDNEGDSILTNIKPLISPLDRNEGRERLGMGVFIAKWLQSNKDSSIFQSLLRYVSFVRNKLQAPDYQVFSNITHQERRHRGYNYPWVADLYLQMYKLTGQPNYIKDYYFTLESFYKHCGYQFYAIGIPLQEGITLLKKAGLQNESDSLLSDFIKMGDCLVKNSIYYPKSEVNYEQSIVAPAVLFLLELYTVTKEQKYLEEAKLQMHSLEAFSGRQPDVHLNEIAIRHWDGYWFGKRASWGETMPQYWSTLTAMAYKKYCECTSDKSFLERANRIVENNLLNFKEDGRASCAYLYPLTINGKAGKFYDPFANDQDWALFYYLQVKNTQ